MHPGRLAAGLAYIFAGIWAVPEQDEIAKEELLDGIYVVRTSEPSERLTAADGVRSYKRLAFVEQAFRCLKGIDLLVRPIHHRTADRVRAHILLCRWRLLSMDPNRYEVSEPELLRSLRLS